ncbi:bifunctional 3-demethylubiquinone-9 3-methyltransferase/ 2-octaprenyl-6-hydroxy phenol methylase [compost metagenome]
MDDSQQHCEASEIERKKGDDFFLNQHLSLAADVYKKILDLDNHNIKTLNNLGALHEQLGEIERSTELYRRACSLLNSGTKNADIYYKNLARACTTTKDISLGIWAYEKAIETEGNACYETAVKYLDLLSNAYVSSHNRRTLITLEKIYTIEKIDLELLSHLYYRNLLTESTVDTSLPYWPSILATHLFEKEFSLQLLTTHIITNPILEILLERSKAHLAQIDKKNNILLSTVIDAQHHLSQHAFNTDRSEFNQFISNKQTTSKLAIQKPRGQNRSLNKLVHKASLDPLRSFYESNPYPKWTYLPNHIPGTIYDYLYRTGLNNKKNPSRKIKILNAGCGTGRHAIQMALNYPDAEIYGIDISLSSLRYANLMKQNHNIENAKFIHCSIFDIANLKIKFHIIECIGVLHHFKQPHKGIKPLLMALHKNGILKLGLYSKIARTPIDTLKNKCTEHNITYSPKNLTAIRRLAVTQHPEELESIIWSRDFYSHQGCMDLLFNPHEDNYTLKRIYDLLQTYNLDFCGFENNLIQAPSFTKFNSRTDLKALLRKWHLFEETNPTTFSNMYLFWVKPRNNHANPKL